MNRALTMLYLGCPQWSNTAWKGQLFAQHCQQSQMLARYSEVFNAVEGNTTFYADPSPDVVKRWLHSSDKHFRFTFKFPKRFSHDSALQAPKQELTHWLKLIAPLFSKVGSLMLQLPASFTPTHLPRLQHFIAQLPKDLHYSVEVRHRDFFTKGDSERALNRFLHQHKIDRVCMDTRALFAVSPYSDAIIDAQQKKPHLPVHAVALGERPVVRFVIAALSDEYQHYYQPWLAKIKQWLDEGKSPYVFLHTADNDGAPLLARQFAQDLQRFCGYYHRAVEPFPGEKHQQEQLF